MRRDHQLVDDIVSALEVDGFKQHNGTLRGPCPSCGKREAWTQAATPYVVFCPRAKRCGEQHMVRDLFPFLFENITARHPVTEANPNAGADAYLQGTRGFDLTILLGEYIQKDVAIYNKESEKTFLVPTVYVPLWEGHYWARVINAEDVRRVGKKVTFSRGIKYRNRHWAPRRQTIARGDIVYIVEGIFHAQAFHHDGYKSVAALANTNLPRDLIEQHRDNDIHWILAYDDDPGSRRYSKKYYRELEQMGQRVSIALTGSERDWDDIWQQDQGKFQASFLDECFFRGRLLVSERPRQTAYHHYCHYGRGHMILAHNNRLYQIVIQVDDLKEEIERLLENGKQRDIGLIDPLNQGDDTPCYDRVLLSDDGQRVFNSYVHCTMIANCYPQFLYAEIERVSGEIAYCFQVNFPHDRSQQIQLSGSAIESPVSFNKALLNTAAGASFDGEKKQLKHLRDDWFFGGINKVESIPFVGYHRETKLYVFPSFGYAGGRYLKPNGENYLSHGKAKIKTSYKSAGMVEIHTFEPAIIADIAVAFGDNGLMTLAFWLGSLVAEQIRQRDASYPFLEMSGLPGTGKSTILELLWRMCGRRDYEGFDPSKATAAARGRIFVQYANLPVVLMEGDRNGDHRRGAFDFNELKSMYNGRGIRARGSFNRGNDTEEPPFRGAVIIAQNAEVDADAAVMERIVHCHYDKSNFTPTSKAAADRLLAARAEDCGGFIQAVLAKELAILACYEQHYPRIEQLFSDHGLIKNQRLIKNHAQIAALGYCLPLIFPAMSAKQAEQLQGFIERRGIVRLQRLSSDHPDVVIFWEAFELIHRGPDLASNAVALSVDDIELLNHAKNPRHIAISMAEVYQQAEKRRVYLPRMSDVKKLLPHGVQYRFIGAKNVNSRLKANASKFCWVFEAPLSPLY